MPTGQVEAVGAATQVLQPEAPEAAPAPTADGGPPPGPGRARAPRGRPRADRRRRAAEPGPRPQLPDMPALDGLRAVALLAILAFHQGFDLAGGGFLGISSFLTLSGFLLATSMLAEWSQNGRLALGRLWLQRARRLGPPLVLTLAAVVVLQVVLRVGSGPGYKVDVLAALGQALNWRFALSDDGFARVLIDPSPVQHLWGLSVLAQLTLVLPPVFAGVMRLTGRHWRLAGALFGAAAVASFAGAAFVADRFGNESWAYFGTHTRAGELLVGVTLGFVVLSPAVRGIVGSPRGLAALRYGAPAALLVLAVLWSTTGLYSSNLFRGVTALNAVLTAWIVFSATVPGPLTTALGSLPLRTLGRLSYAAFLLHWPLFLLLDHDRIGLEGPPLFLVRVAATLVAAAAVTYGLERPVRRRVPERTAGVAVAGALAVVSAAAAVLPEQPPPGVHLAVDDGRGAGDLDVVVPTGDEVASVVVVGDSLAASLVPGFEAWNAEHPDEQVRVHTHVAEDCPLSAPGPVRLAGRTIGEDVACLGFEARLPILLEEADPDVVVVVPSVADLGEREIDREWAHLGDVVFDDWLWQELTDLAGTLEGAGVPVVWTTAPHVRLAPADEGDWTTVAENDPARVDRLNEIVRAVVAGRDGSVVADLGAWAQRLPRGEFGPDHRAEGRDLTEAGATSAVSWLVPELRAVLDGGDGGEDAAPADGG